MATVRVEQPHALSIDDAKKALEKFAEDIAKYGMKLHWSGSEAELKGIGASGDVKVHSDKVVVTVKLGMMAKAAGVKADRLEGSIARRLQSALASET